MKHAWEKFLKRRGYKLRCTIGEGAYSKVRCVGSATKTFDIFCNLSDQLWMYQINYLSP